MNRMRMNNEIQGQMKLILAISPFRARFSNNINTIPTPPRHHFRTSLGHCSTVIAVWTVKSELYDRGWAQNITRWACKEIPTGQRKLQLAVP
jgi:hypothetical protein